MASVVPLREAAGNPVTELEAQAKLNRDNTLLAERQAREAAANPQLLDLARGAARDAVRQNLTIPLEVAGYGPVTVSVRFDGEPAPPR